MDLGLEHFMDVQRKRVRQRCKVWGERIERRRQERLSDILQVMDNEHQIAAISHASGRRRPDMEQQEPQR